MVEATARAVMVGKVLKNHWKLLSKALAVGVIGLFLFAGWSEIPTNVTLSDPRILPLLKAMDQVDRAALGFSPIATNTQISLELQSGSTYDAMLHVYGATSRTIAFRKTGSGYRWISEQEIYEGPKWHQTVDGTFREQMVIEFQTEQVNGIPTNTLSIRYTGSDPNLEGRNFTLADVRPILEEWRVSPVEPQPADLPDNGYGSPMLAAVVLFAVPVFLIALGATAAIALILVAAFGALAAILLTAGIVSTALLAGVLRKSVSAGFRALFIQLGALIGVIGGVIATSSVTLITKAAWNSPLRWVTGIGIGFLVGILIAWIFNLVWSGIAQWLAEKLEKRQNCP
jgi:hypothetical protein